MTLDNRVNFLFFQHKVFYNPQDHDESHSQIAQRRSVPEDKCLKLIYHQDKDGEYLYGIKGLSYSIAKDFKSYEPKAYDLYKIEKFILELDYESEQKKSYLKRWEQGLDQVMYLDTSYPGRDNEKALEKNQNGLLVKSLECKINNMNDWILAGLLDSLIEMHM